MRCTVQTSKGPIGIYEANDEGDSWLRPTRVIDEGGEDELGMFVGGRGCWDGDEDDEEREE